MKHFVPIGAITFLLLAASMSAEADPYNWNMSCERWQERAREILLDESLGTWRNRYWLASHLRTKVEGECITPDQL